MYCKIALSVLFLVFIVTMTLNSEDASKLPTTTVVVSRQVKVEAELAYTDEARMKGLMFREFLAPDAGMLFVFSVVEPQGFWMKNTKISLDLIWLNERKEIVYFVTAEPCKGDPCPSYLPMQKAKYVLEVNAGFVKKNGLKLGTPLEFHLPPEAEK